MTKEEFETALAKEKQRALPYNALGNLYHKYASSLFREGKYEEYLYYSSLSAYYYVTHNFTFVPGSCLSEVYKRKKPMEYTEQSFARFLKKLQKTDVAKEYEATFMIFLNEYKEDLMAIKKKNYFINGESEESNRKYSFYTEELFKAFYEKELKPIVFGS